MNNSGNIKNTVYCIYCGYENDRESKFCISCGKKIETVEAKEAPAFDEAQAPADNTPAFDTAEYTEITLSPDDKNEAEAAMAFDAAEESAPAFAASEENNTPAFSEASDFADAAELDSTIIQSPKIKPLEKTAAPAFGSVEENKEEAEKAEPAAEEKKARKAYTEEDFAFATGLPEWSLEPPQVMVRRHRS